MVLLKYEAKEMDAFLRIDSFLAYINNNQKINGAVRQVFLTPFRGFVFFWAL